MYRANYSLPKMNNREEEEEEETFMKNISSANNQCSALLMSFRRLG